jgi:hypothetical protein
MRPGSAESVAFQRSGEKTGSSLGQALQLREALVELAADHLVHVEAGADNLGQERSPRIRDVSEIIASGLA